ncbi:hypothetical protein [Actinacidiphila acididurans]|uniref:Polysaccharide chain length determinant N-terminal domain-containing protein n=1 Tax=Actinacidiphila acididurans TaxID=2784346 RepID=A0ABS2TM08_9ACTN|nr:hypothetical protein [Actinacidiphila acididurans]MBM9503531.1 hypothetical protein [Actinacidiphila acididurans]
MSPGEVVLALLRRWYVLLLALVLTAAGAYHVLKPAPRYLSSAVVVLKPPVTGNQPNQFANLQPPLAAVSYAVVQQLKSPAGEAELRAAGVHGTYRLLPRNSGTSVTPAYLIPSLQVQAQLGDPGRADTEVRAIIAAYSRHVDAMQAAEHVPAASRMSVDLLVPPNAAQVLGTRTRALAGVGIIGLTGGLLAALWTDRYLTRRRAGGGRWRRTAARLRPMASR